MTSHRLIGFSNVGITDYIRQQRNFRQTEQIQIFSHDLQRMRGHKMRQILFSRWRSSSTINASTALTAPDASATVAEPPLQRSFRTYSQNIVLIAPPYITRVLIAQFTHVCMTRDSHERINYYSFLRLPTYPLGPLYVGKVIVLSRIM